jgi:xanthine dehydrogenase iron-sulfur cluster and FAD-binding subunit A
MTNTHILLEEFEYLEPATLGEAIALLKEHGEEAELLAGGTHLVVQMKLERTAPACVINLKRLPGLRGISHGAEGLHVGPLTKICAVRDDPRVRTGYAALADACASFGSMQIQRMGTLGGNLSNASPASDAVPALMAYEAQLTVAGPDGERQMSVEEFLVGPGQTALRPGEILTDVLLPEPPAGAGSAFIKLSRVTADLAKVSVAAVIVRDGNQVVDCRLAFGSVAPTVIRAREAEQVLAGRPFSAELALEAGERASQAVTPIDDIRSNAWYRREVVKALTHDVLHAAWERAGASTEALPDAPASAGDATRAETLHLGPEDRHPIELTVNGVARRLEVAPNDLLLNVLRDRLGLTGAKYGCGIGECGACTIHLNGHPALSCLVLAVDADGSDVLTVEGLQGPDGELHEIQQAFIDHSAFQCGYCTPGMLMMTKDLLDHNPRPSEDEIRDQLKGNRCRCTGFTSIVRAVMDCVKEE